MSEPLQAEDARFVPPLAIFTDFDGTLVDIAQTPGAIEVPAELPAEIAHVANCLDGAMAVISGRTIADLDNYLPASIAVSGGQGTERRRGDGTRVGLTPGRDAEAMAIAERLEYFVRDNPYLLLERKGAAVALHFRQAPDLREACLEAMQDAIRTSRDFGTLEGKMVFEARPLDAGKGAAIVAFMREAPFRGRIPVFFGDDASDEDGFIVAQDMGGVGVKVGAGDTAARMRATDTAVARAIMRGLASRAAGATLRRG